jgi:molybdate transport system substrate-binding protein
MKNARPFGCLFLIARLTAMAATSLAFSSPSLAQLNVIISGGFSGAYRQVLPEFERSTGITVVTGSGASQGTGPQTIVAQLQSGVPADVVILSREGLAELAASGRIATGTEVDLARVPLAAAVRAGAPKPDVTTIDALKQALLSARTIAVPGSTSGIFLTTKVFPQLGIADRINVKVTERGSQSAAMVAAGSADIVIQPISELMNVAGIEVVGRIPNDVQLIQTFAGALVVGSTQSVAGRRLLEFLASERTSSVIEQHGMDPVKKRAAN